MVTCRFGCAAELGPAFIKMGRRCPVCDHKMFPTLPQEGREWARYALKISANRMGIMPQLRRRLFEKAKAL